MESISKIDYDNYRIIIVDNGSDSNEIESILLEFPNVEIIRSKENLGFSGGNNLGIVYSIELGADYIALLNNDTTVQSDFLTRLVKLSNSDKKVGIAVPKINYYSDPNRIWYAGGFISKFRGSGYTIGEGKTSEKYTKNRYVSFATGCCLLIKAKAIKKIGLMDPNYFLYLEDVDYCMRTLLTGYKILFVGQSSINHKVSISSTKYNILSPLYYVTRNRLYFVKKFYHNYYWIPFIIITLIFSFKSIFWLIMGEKRKSMIVKKAIDDYIANRMGKCEEL